ncbi:MAG: hypothetical protein KGZ87_08855 [Bacteroidetes bacterium]|nr:hypothetical protein [Bacteroidota bacterium]
MIPITVILKNIKIVFYALAIVLIIYFIKENQRQQKEIHRLSENITQIVKYDSTRYAEQTYTKQELKEYLEYNRQDLQKFLQENKIAIKNVQKIITTKLSYKDTTVVNTDLQPVLDAIKTKNEINVPIIDTNECLTIKGNIMYADDVLKLSITERIFKNTSDVVTHTERKQWKFLFIKSKLFGRKYTEVTINDKCGTSQTFVIDQKK